MRILLLESLAEPAMQILHNSKGVELLTSFESDFSRIDVNGIEAIITRGKGEVSQKVIDLFPNLKVIARAGVGLNNVDVTAATKRKIKVLNNPGANANTVAEHTMALMLMLQRRLFESVNAVKSDNWVFRNGYGGDELYGKTLGVLGMGNIGQKVAKLAKAFGMEVLYSHTSNLDLEYKYCSFEELLRSSDVLTLHLPLTGETQHIINKKSIIFLKQSALIVNTSRGALVEENALYEGLIDQKIGGYAADVFEEQPPRKNNLLLQLPQVLITPHVASLTAQTYQKMCVDAVRNVLAVLNKQEPQLNCIFNRKGLEE